MAISGSALEAEELSPTDCSEDSVEIRSPRPVLRPKAVPLHAAAGVGIGVKRKWADMELEDKRRRLDADLATGCLEAPSAPDGAPIYPLPHYPASPLFNQWLMSRHSALTGELPWTSWTPLLTPHHAPFPYFHPSALIGGYPPPFPSVYLPPPLPPAYAALPPIYAPSAYAAEKESAPPVKLPRMTPPVDRSSPLIKIRTPPPPSPVPSSASRPASAASINVDDPAPIPAETAPVEPVVTEPAPKALKSKAEGRKRKIRKEKPPPADAEKKPAPFLSVEQLIGAESASSSSETEVKETGRPEEGKSADDPAWTRPTYRDPPVNRNYKNMTRERRMQANARERTRVHTISAAFESLRRAVPSFSHGQRLSKLSILRVASAYIMALGQLADEDGDHSASLTQCVDLCTKTLMTEGQMLRRRRDPRHEPDADDEEDD